jgi:hypothetical protein
MAAPRQRWGVGLGVVAVIFTAALGFGPLARSRIEAMARERGLDIVIQTVRPGCLAVVLHGMQVKLHGVDGFAADLPLATVELSFLLAPKEIRVEGGKVTLSGSVDELKSRLLAWRQSRGSVVTEGRRELPLHASRVTLHWEGETREGKARNGAEVTGLDVTRGGGRLTAAFEMADVRLGSSALAFVGGALVFDGVSTLKSLKLAQADVAFSEATDATQGGTTAKTSAGDLGPPPLPAPAARGQKKGPRPASADDPSALQTVEASAPLVPLPDLHGLRAAAASLASLLTQRLPIGTAVSIDGLKLRLQHGDDERISLGPGPLNVERRENRVEVTFSTGPTTVATAMLVHALLPLDDGDVELSLAGGPVPLSLLGLHAKVLTEPERATLAGKGEVVLDGQGKSLTFDGQLTVRGLTAQDPRLSAETIRGLDFDARARGVLSDRGELRLDDAEASMGALRLATHGTFEQTPDHVAAAVAFDLPVNSCEAALGSIPTALLPTLRGTHMKGTLGAQGRLAFDTRKLDDLSLDYTVEDYCHLTDAPPEIDRERFSKPFGHRIYTPDGKLSEETTGPTTDSWTDLDHISPYMQAAVLTTEDGAFFHHHGFNHAAIRNALLADLKARRFVRGASTITMQLAKNLFLSRDKTLSRKLEELILTDYLEQAFTKDEMMELYLNIIEFGPNVYGITAAADHYFGRKPEELNLAECMFLASILPQPVRYHHLYEHGELPESWLKGIRARMVIAQRTAKITEGELAEGLTEGVTFHLPNTPRPPPRAPVMAARSDDESSRWQDLN